MSQDRTLQESQYRLSVSFIGFYESYLSAYRHRTILAYRSDSTNHQPASQPASQRANQPTNQPPASQPANQPTPNQPTEVSLYPYHAHLNINIYTQSDFNIRHSASDQYSVVSFGTYVDRSYNHSI